MQTVENSGLPKYLTVCPRIPPADADDPSSDKALAAGEYSQFHKKLKSFLSL